MAWNIIGVPVDCLGAEPGSAPFGTELSPDALRDLSVVERVVGVDHGNLSVRVVGTHRDEETGLVGGTSVHDVVAQVRAAAARLLGGSDRLLVLGGCCIPLMGVLAGARDSRGDIGLVYIDGHLDLYDHLTSPTGEAADMPTAAVLGRGEPGLLRAMEAPVLAAGRLAVLGARDPDEWPVVGDLVNELNLHVVSTAAIAVDPQAAASAAIARAGEGAGFWVHLDVDVFDESEFPATDYLMPNGLTITAGRELLAHLAADDRMLGLSVGCYNPQKDPGAACGRDLVEMIAHVAHATP